MFLFNAKMACLLLIFLFGICCARQQLSHCTPDQAYSIGTQKANNSELSTEEQEIFEQCSKSKKEKTTFLKHYQLGRNQKIIKICNLEYFIQKGKIDGGNGDTDYPGLKLLKICEQLPDAKLKAQLKQNYLTRFNQHFCSEKRLSHLGIEDAQNLEETKTDIISNYCDKNIQPYLNHYLAELKLICTPFYVHNRAIEDAQKGRPLNIELKKLKICSKIGQALATNIYKKSYYQEIQKSDPNIKSEIPNRWIASFNQNESLKNQDPQAMIRKNGLNTETYSYQNGPVNLSCQLKDKGKMAKIDIYNPNRHRGLSMSGAWYAFIYDAQGVLLGKQIKLVKRRIYPSRRESVYLEILPSMSAARPNYCLSNFRPELSEHFLAKWPVAIPTITGHDLSASTK